MTGTLKGQHAGFVSRLVAYGIDLAIIVISLIALGWMISVTRDLFQLQSIIPEGPARVALAGMATFLFVSSYYVFFWSLAGQTPGKMLMGLRIVTPGGEPPNFWRSVRRFIGYIISLIPFFAGFWWILFDNRRQGWHDKLAGTYVIYIWDAEPGQMYAAKMQQQEVNRQGD